ncbi:MAG TPA: carboxypeptidase-like regulatory domain-containing protein, partial [Pedobacter sp.]|nr:carboxypeptidase-like regulatory domain-containing protein [Pedobacter sp.]
MKLTTLLLIITMLHVSASSFAQRITLSKKNVVLTEVLDQIRIQTGYDFIFNNSILKNAKKVNIAVKNAELAEVLEQVFADQPLQYKINENKSVVITKKDMSVVAKIMDFFSAIDVRGKVVDEQGEPLPGASVKVKGGSIGAVTDRDGEFFLKGLPEDAVIVIVYLGYKPLELKASASMGIMKLEQVSSELKEIVINKG